MNNVYELLNDAKMELEDYENQKLSDYEIHRLKKQISKEVKAMNKKKSKYTKSAIAVCICAVLLFQVGTAAVLAGILPIPEAIKSVFGIDSKDQEESAASMGTAINISSVDRGYKTTATGVLRDSKHVCITYRIEKADGSTLDKEGRKCTKAEFLKINADDSCLGGEVDMLNQTYNPYYIEYATIWNYGVWNDGEGIDQNIKISLGELGLWFDHEENARIEIDGEWNFEIPTTIEDSSVNVAEGQILTFGKNSGKLEELRVSPIGYSIRVSSGEEVHGNEMIKGIDGQLWIYLKSGEKILCSGASGPVDEGDGSWSFKETGTFEKLIPLSSMDKIVLGEYEIKIDESR